MTEDTLKQVIVDYVTGVQGCKATELAAVEHVVMLCHDLKVGFPRIISDLVDEGRLVEVEYSVPNLPERIKSFLLPPDSVLYGALNKVVHEPGEPIIKTHCPSCGVALSVEYGDDLGEIGVVSHGNESGEATIDDLPAMTFLAKE